MMVQARLGSDQSSLVALSSISDHASRPSHVMILRKHWLIWLVVSEEKSFANKPPCLCFEFLACGLARTWPRVGGHTITPLNNPERGRSQHTGLVDFRGYFRCADGNSTSVCYESIVYPLIHERLNALFEGFSLHLQISALQVLFSTLSSIRL